MTVRLSSLERDLMEAIARLSDCRKDLDEPEVLVLEVEQIRQHCRRSFVASEDIAEAFDRLLELRFIGVAWVFGAQFMDEAPQSIRVTRIGKEWIAAWRAEREARRAARRVREFEGEKKAAREERERIPPLVTEDGTGMGYIALVPNQKHGGVW